jgi:hypothetical protein
MIAVSYKQALYSLWCWSLCRWLNLGEQLFLVALDFFETFSFLSFLTDQGWCLHNEHSDTVHRNRQDEHGRPGESCESLCTMLILLWHWEKNLLNCSCLVGISIIAWSQNSKGCRPNGVNPQPLCTTVVHWLKSGERIDWKPQKDNPTEVNINMGCCSKEDVNCRSSSSSLGSYIACLSMILIKYYVLDLSSSSSHPCWCRIHCTQWYRPRISIHE